MRQELFGLTTWNVPTKNILATLEGLVNKPSPSGHTEKAIALVEERLTAEGIQTIRNRKGGLIATLPGENDQEQRMLTAHVDTLGAMVKEIKPSGRLKIDLIGGFKFNAVEGEYCKVETQDGKIITGTILMHQTSVHVYKDVGSAERNQTNMEIRLDEKVNNAEEVRQLGIEVGDFVSFDPRFQILETGFVKSRHLDDKLSVAILMELMIDITEKEITLPFTTHVLISNNEEIGYGGNSNIPDEVVEYLAVDMGAMGDGQTTDEYTVSICAKDASGPYHLGLRRHLTDLAKQNNIPYKVDIYPYYGSDASAAIRSGNDIVHGLLGAGIDSSHAYERTHQDSIEATAQLLRQYLHSDKLIK